MKAFKKKLSSFIAFDIETATSKRNSICQIGYSRVIDLQIAESKSFLVKPPDNEYSAFNSCLHGITSLETRDAATFPEVWSQIESEFKRNILVAHNAAFDSTVLIETLEYYNINIPQLEFVCSYQLTNLNLKALCESLNIILEDHHNALADAKACAVAMIKLLQGIEPNHSLIKKNQKKNSFEFEGHPRIKGDLLKPDLDVEDKNNPFYSMKVVLTGVLKTMSRQEAAQILKSKGADIDTNVTKRTKYVIAGPGAGPSKLKKIDQFNLQGANIEILDEEMFLCMVR